MTIGNWISRLRSWVLKSNKPKPENKLPVINSYDFKEYTGHMVVFDLYGTQYPVFFNFKDTAIYAVKAKYYFDGFFSPSKKK